MSGCKTPKSRIHKKHFSSALITTVTIFSPIEIVTNPSGGLGGMEAAHNKILFGYFRMSKGSLIVELSQTRDKNITKPYKNAFSVKERLALILEHHIQLYTECNKKKV